MSSNLDRENTWLDAARQTWSERAEAWDAMSAANAGTQDRGAELERWMRSLNLSPGSRLLDAGCGSGHFAIAFAQRECEVTGIDLSPAMIERARANAASAGVDIELVTAPLAPLTLSDDAYDAIFCRMALHLTPTPIAVLGEFRRVLRDDGRLYASVPGALSPIYAASWRRHLDDEVRPVNDMTPWELESLLRETGWTIRESWGDWSGQGDDERGNAGSIAQESGSMLLQQATATSWGFIAN